MAAYVPSMACKELGWVCYADAVSPYDTSVSSIGRAGYVTILRLSGTVVWSCSPLRGPKCVATGMELYLFAVAHLVVL
jgi:hypothetical protein